jgi:hypothetical protein
MYNCVIVKFYNYAGAGVGVGMHAGMRAGVQAMWYLYANALSYEIACIVFGYMKIFVCLIKQSRMVAIISKFGGRG